MPLDLTIQSEVPDYTTAEALLLKSVDYFNKQLQEKGCSVSLLDTDVTKFHVRIAKKKSGLPNSDYPSK